MRLKRIFRQEEGSGIVENAALIRKGEMCVPDEAGEFRIVYAADDEDAYRIVMDYAENLITGMKRIKCCCRCFPPCTAVCARGHLNESLTRMIHGKRFRWMKFFPGDKVMQTRNDYENVR